MLSPVGLAERLCTRVDERLGPVTDHATRISRRALLAAGVGAAGLAAACTTRKPKPGQDPDAAAVESARATELTLLQSYGEGTQAHAAHLAHLHALGGTVATASPSPSPTTTTPRLEGTTVAPLLDMARRVQRGEIAALLASIAASHAVMAGSRAR